MRRHPNCRTACKSIRRTASDPAGHTAVDLQISVQTSLLNSRPTLTTATALNDAELLHLVANESQPSRHRYDLFRPRGCGVSYVEMIHPADEAAGALFVGGLGVNQRNPPGGIHHHLFASFLEKGVIVRARLRGLFLPREHDTELAAEAYGQFLAAPPPLTT